MGFLWTMATASSRLATEDRVATHAHSGGVVVVVADGAGGIAKGGPAADAFMHAIARALAETPDVFATSNRIVEFLYAIDRSLGSNRDVGQTTGVVVVVTEQGVHGASCGDSAAWIVDERGLDELTANQKPGLRVGSGRANPIGFARPALDGTLLVGTDGLFNYAAVETIATHARNPSVDAGASALIESVRMASRRFRDDVALALVRRSG